MKYLVTAFILCIAPQAAIAKDTAGPSEGWQSQNVSIRYTGLGVKREMRGVINPAETIYSGDTTTSGNVVFTCFAGRFTASFASAPIDFASIITQKKVAKGGFKRKRLKFKTAGETSEVAGWAYIPKLEIYRAGRRSAAAKLYNAAIRGDDVQVKIRGKGYQPLNLPPVDAAFKTFGAECGLGIHANKS